MTKVWSPYQLNVFEAVKKMAAWQPSQTISILDDDKQVSLQVRAVAGSGKTTTIVESMKLIPSTHKVIYVVFNSHNAAEASKKVPFNVEARTINSFGWRACKANLNNIGSPNQYKTRDILESVVPDRDRARQWSSPMERLVGLKKATYSIDAATGKGRFQSANELASQFDLDLPTDPQFMQAAGEVWERCLKQTRILDFDDQWLFPVYYRMQVPQYDWIFIDEAQDLSACQIELVKKVAPRIVAVGDPRQAIYMFRGADAEAMDRLRDMTKAEVLPLSVCYRCPKVVVTRAASVIAPDVILPHEAAIDGQIDEVQAAKLRDEAKPGSWVLCRNTAPLVKACLRFIVEGVKASVKGKDLGLQLCGLVTKVAAGTDDVLVFSERLAEYHKREQERLIAAKRDAQLEALDDRVEALHAFSEGAANVSGVKAAIQNVFRDEASPGVTFATMHRAKGLEADDIYILPGNAKAKSAAAQKQEANLTYVAYTRAMKRLRFVK